MKRTSCKYPFTTINHSVGFTLIEVLIALLVLAIGLVGIASLHLAGLRNAHSSYYTSIASSVALDFEERLWLAMDEIEDGCLSGEDIESTDETAGIIPDLVQAWGSGAAGSTTIPGLEVDLVSFTTDVAGFWAEARIVIGWPEGRFGQTAESFPYTARVICAPDLST